MLFQNGQLMGSITIQITKYKSIWFSVSFSTVNAITSLEMINSTLCINISYTSSEVCSAFVPSLPPYLWNQKVTHISNIICKKYIPEVIMKICHHKADYSDNYTECGTLQGAISQAFKVSWQHYTKCLSKIRFQVLASLKCIINLLMDWKCLLNL